MHDPFKLPPDQPPDDHEPRIPDALRHDLKHAYSPADPIDIPTEIDDQLLHLARHRLSQRVATTAGSPRDLSWAHPDGAKTRTRRPFPLRLITMSAAAAAILLVALLSPRLLTPPPVATPNATTIALRGDIDDNGRVDIVDALRLATLLSTDHPPSRLDWDLNADGVVNEQDALSIRSLVVKLDGGA